MLRRSKNLAYSRKTHDKRIYGLYTYTCSIPQIAKALFRNELERAKRRVIVTNNGKYMYTPSKEYISFFKKHYKTINHD